MENINWEDIDTNIKNLKYPLSFLYNLFKSNKLSDNNLSIIIRFFFKYHNNIAFDFNLIDLSNILSDNYKITKKNIKNFYRLIKKKYTLGNKLKFWYESYKKNNFWKKKIINQIEELEKIKMIFYSNFDVCKSNVFFHNKIYNILLFNKDDTFNLNHLINRLRNVYLLFGNNFFKKYKIILITRNKFIEIDFKDKIKYCTYLFQKINKIILNIIYQFNLFYHTNTQLNNLLNPKYLNIKLNNEKLLLGLDDLLFMIKN